MLFAIQGDTITSQPQDVAMIALPLLAYFAVMWVAGFAIGKLIGFPYAQTASLCFTVASNDFELAIAVAVGVFGAASGEALAGVVGPLIEVPVLVALVYVALWARRFWVSATISCICRRCERLIQLRRRPREGCSPVLHARFLTPELHVGRRPTGCRAVVCRRGRGR